MCFQPIIIDVNVTKTMKKETACLRCLHNIVQIQVPRKIDV
jgi:hypothetical protein